MTEPSKFSKIYKPTQTVYTFLAIVLLLVGCGVKPASDSGGAVSSSLRSATVVGQFTDAQGNPIANLRLIDMGSGLETHTDKDGICEIDLSNPSGSAEFALEGAQSSGHLVIADIPSDAELIEFEAVLSGSEATLKSLQFNNFDTDEDSASDPVTEIDDSSSNDTNSNDSSSDSSNNSSSSNKQSSSKKKKSSNTQPAPPSNSSPDPFCLTCHVDRGAPRCGDKNWEALHSFYKCPKKGGKKKARLLNNYDYAELMRVLRND